MAKKKHLTSSAIARLGKVLDSILAAECDISVSAVTQQRRKRGIPALRARSEYRRWTAKEEALLGKDIDANVAEKLGRKRKSLRSHRLLMGIAGKQPPKLMEIVRISITQNK